jgi:hypothetical protein
LNIKLFISGCVFIFFLNTIVSDAQILKKESSVNLVKETIRCIYNYQFKEAGELCNKIKQVHPGHPAEYLLNSMTIFWENYPLLPSSPYRKVFEENLRKCIKLSEDIPDNIYESEYILTNLCARGLLLLFYVNNNLNLDVIPLALSSYPYIRKSFNYTSVCADFNYFTGVYNYYREVYPKTYPVYKPLAALLPGGDRIRGIKDLQNASATSILLRAESYSFLSEVFIRFENDYSHAILYNKSLHELYPDNPEYEETYIKNLLLIKKYNEAETQIAELSTKPLNPFFKAQLGILNGILKEKMYHDYVTARELYMEGIQDISSYGYYSNEFTAYAYYGLSRISDIRGDKNYKKIYRKLADDKVELKKVNFDQ